MPIFDKKQEITRSELREKLRKTSPDIPGTGGKMYEIQDRIKMEREIFGKKYGSFISRDEYKRALREMEIAKYRVKTGVEKIEIDRKIRFLKKLGEK